MDTLISKIKCSVCDGVGCPSCDNTGYIVSSSAILDVTVLVEYLSWIKTKIKKILKKLDLPEE